MPMGMAYLELLYRVIINVLCKLFHECQTMHLSICSPTTLKSQATKPLVWIAGLTQHPILVFLLDCIS